MKRYEPSQPHIPAIAAAAAMAALTIFVAVYAPAIVPATTVATAQKPAAPIEVAITPSTIEVIGVRHEKRGPDLSDRDPLTMLSL